MDQAMTGFVDSLAGIEHTIEMWRNIFLLMTAVAWLACAGFSGYVAEQKGYRPLAWGGLGLLFGLMALIAVAGLPDRSQRMAHEQVPDHIGLGQKMEPDDPELIALLSRLKRKT